MSDPAPKTDEREAQDEPPDLDTAIRRRVLSRDGRYHINAYRFIYEALEHTQQMRGRRPESDSPEDRHVTGQELLDGIRDCAQSAFGPLAPCVFRSWGVQRTEDFGEIVFSLVEAGLMGKTDRDSRADFANGYDFDAAFDGPVRIK